MKPIYLFCITALIAALILPSGSAAALPGETTIVVNTFTDEYNYSANSTCSLREAITTAVSDAAFGGCTNVNSGEDTRISLATGTYEMGSGSLNDDNTSGDLDIYETAGQAEQITISGAGRTATFIDGNSFDRIFDLNANAIVVLEDLTLTYGQSQPADSHAGYGGGIFTEGTLTLQDVGVSYCTAGRTGMTAPGGGIYNSGSLNLYDSRVEWNGTLSASATLSAGGGGGIYNTGSVNMERSVVSDNTTGNGGTTTDASANGGDGAGIYSTNTLIIYSSSISENFAGSSSTSMGRGGHGGGIYNLAFAMIHESTLYGNQTGRGFKNDGGDGGGIYNGGMLLMYNTSVIRNATAYGATGPTDYGKAGDGGGLYSTNSASIYLSTFAENTNATGTPNGNGGGIYLTGSTRYLNGTIVANNISSGTSVDCYGDLVNSSYNLVENTTGCTFSGTFYNNLPGVDPQLREVQLLGYYLYGFPLSRTSPAVDKVLGCASDVDQRGAVRPIDGDGNGSAVCDMGALELGTPFFVPLVRKP